MFVCCQAPSTLCFFFSFLYRGDFLFMGDAEPGETSDQDEVLRMCVNGLDIAAPRTRVSQGSRYSTEYTSVNKGCDFVEDDA